MYTPVGQYSSHERVSWLLGTFLVSMCLLFNFSIIDILMYHTNMECKDFPSNLGMSLSSWLQINGVLGLTYTVYSLLFLFVLFEIYEKTRLIQIFENIIKGGFIGQTIFSFIWSIIGLYMMGSYYHELCQFSFFKTYMWIKLCISIIVSFLWIVLFCVKIKTFFNDKIRSYFYQVNTTYQPVSTAYSN